MCVHACCVIVCAYVCMYLRTYVFFAGVYYEKANFSSLPPHYFNSTDSDFGTVDFTVYKFPNSFSFYNIEAVLSTTDRRPARCAVATSYASAYSGVTEIVSV